MSPVRTTPGVDVFAVFARLAIAHPLALAEFLRRQPDAAERALEVLKATERAGVVVGGLARTGIRRVIEATLRQRYVREAEGFRASFALMGRRSTESATRLDALERLHDQAELALGKALAMPDMADLRGPLGDIVAAAAQFEANFTGGL